MGANHLPIVINIPVTILVKEFPNNKKSEIEKINQKIAEIQARFKKIY